MSRKVTKKGRDSRTGRFAPIDKNKRGERTERAHTEVPVPPGDKTTDTGPRREKRKK